VALIEQRRKQQEGIAATIGGTAENDAGAGPSHWYENANAHNSRAWSHYVGGSTSVPAKTEPPK
jgi:hypothetical protein